MTRSTWLRLGLAWAFLPFLSSTLEAKQNQGPVIARMLSPQGTMLNRTLFGQPWEEVKQNQELTGGPTLLGLHGAVLQSANGAVQLNFLGDINDVSPFPVRETAVVLPTEASKTDLDFTLERGRIDLVNTRKTGTATVRVTVLGEAWDLTLLQPGNSVAMEIFGRWPRGVPFNPNPGPKEGPNVNLIILVIKGEIQVKHEGVQNLMQAPPGLALLHWDSFHGADPVPLKLDKLPDWSYVQATTEEGKKRAALLMKVRQLASTKSLNEVLDQLVNSEDPLERKFAVYAMGALDDLPRLATALQTTKYPDVWDNGVLALRHWIGRAPGQDLILYRGLIENKKLTPLEAETVMSLLHSFGDDELKRVETYELLVGYLGHELLPIRGLANWHLKRLADPKAVEAIGYDPLAPKEQRDKAAAQWRELLRKGELPPKKNEQRETTKQER